MVSHGEMGDGKMAFGTMMLQLRPYFIVFFVSGMSLITGFYFILFPLIKNQVVCQFKKKFLKQAVAEDINSGIFAID